MRARDRLARVPPTAGPSLRARAARSVLTPLIPSPFGSSPPVPLSAMRRGGTKGQSVVPPLHIVERATGGEDGTQNRYPRPSDNTGYTFRYLRTSCCVLVSCAWRSAASWGLLAAPVEVSEIVGFVMIAPRSNSSFSPLPVLAGVPKPNPKYGPAFLNLPWRVRVQT